MPLTTESFGALAPHGRLFDLPEGPTEHVHFVFTVGQANADRVNEWTGRRKGGGQWFFEPMGPLNHGWVWRLQLCQS
jgi:hypothetical protein